MNVTQANFTIPTPSDAAAGRAPEVDRFEFSAALRSASDAGTKATAKQPRGDRSTNADARQAGEPDRAGSRDAETTNERPASADDKRVDEKPHGDAGDAGDAPRDPAEASQQAVASGDGRSSADGKSGQGGQSTEAPRVTGEASAKPGELRGATIVKPNPAGDAAVQSGVNAQAGTKPAAEGQGDASAARAAASEAGKANGQGGATEAAKATTTQQSAAQAAPATEATADASARKPAQATAPVSDQAAHQAASQSRAADNPARATQAADGAAANALRASANAGQGNATNAETGDGAGGQGDRAQAQASANANANAAQGRAAEGSNGATFDAAVREASNGSQNESSAVKPSTTASASASTAEPAPSAMTGPTAAATATAAATGATPGGDAGAPSPTSFAQSATMANATQAGTADADGARVAEQAMRGMRSVLDSRGGTVTLRLNPPELGSLRIEVRLNAGNVQANFEASNAQAGSLLNQHMQALRTALENQGLTVDRLNVQHQPAAPTTHAQGHHQQQTGDAPNDGRSRGSFDQQGGSSDGRGGSGARDGSQDDQRRQQFQHALLDMVA